MKRNGSMEVVTFHMVEGTKLEEALKGIGSLDAFYRSSAGYQGMQVARDDKTGVWTLVLAWDASESERAASAAMMTSDRTNGFKQLVVPQTVQKKMYPCYTPVHGTAC